MIVYITPGILSHCLTYLLRICWQLHYSDNTWDAANLNYNVSNVLNIMEHIEAQSFVKIIMMIGRNVDHMHFR